MDTRRLSDSLPVRGPKGCSPAEWGQQRQIPGQDAAAEMADGQELIGVALIGHDHHVRAVFLTEPRSGERARIAQFRAALVSDEHGQTPIWPTFTRLGDLRHPRPANRCRANLRRVLAGDEPDQWTGPLAGLVAHRWRLAGGNHFHSCWTAIPEERRARHFRRGRARCYAARQSTSFNDPSREAEKEVKISHG